MYLPTAEGGFSSRSSRVTLCTLPEPHDHIFYVPHAYAAKECVCPFTGLHFMAPSFDGAERRRRRGGSASTSATTSTVSRCSARE